MNPGLLGFPKRAFPLVLQARDATDVPLTVVAAPGQTGNLLSVKTIAGANLLSVGLSGAIVGVGGVVTALDVGRRYFGIDVNDNTTIGLRAGANAGANLAFYANGGIIFGARSINPDMQINSASATSGIELAYNTKRIAFIANYGSDGSGILNSVLGITVTGTAATTTPLFIKGFASQSAKLLVIQDSASAELFSISKEGYPLLTGALRLLGRTTVAGVPTTTELPTDKDLSVHRNSTDGKVYLAYNDSGTIRKVELV